MNENENAYLREFYILLNDNLKREKGLRENSVLISFLGTQSAPRYRLLRKSAMTSDSIPSHILISLLTNGLIQCIEDIDTYAITAKGVWYIEQDLDLIDEESLI